MPKIPKKVLDRLNAEVGRFQKVLLAAKDRDINESDTVVIITDMLSYVFGFEKYSEITSEFAIRGTYCDLAVKIEGVLKYLCEVKAIGTTLKENHLKQAVDYGANKGTDWVVLTNGINWEIHKIKFDRPLSNELVCSINMLEVNPKKESDQEKLFLLCKEGLSKAAIEEFHQHQQSVNRFVVGAILFTSPILDVIRRELRRITPEVRVDTEEIEKLLREEVVKRDVIDGEYAEQTKKMIKKNAQRVLRNTSKDSKPEPAQIDNIDEALTEAKAE
jgi:hypothetical protein